MYARQFVVGLVVVCALLVSGCCDSNSSTSTDVVNDDPVTLTHRNQSDYDVYGYYVNRKLVETKVVRRGEDPVTVGSTGAHASWTRPTGGNREVSGVTYETYYFHRADIPESEEWIIGQPVSSIDVVVPLDQFTIGIAFPELMRFGGDTGGIDVIDSSRPPFNDKFNPETNIYETGDGTGDINITGTLINDGFETVLSGESEDADN